MTDINDPGDTEDMSQAERLALRGTVTPNLALQAQYAPVIALTDQILGSYDPTKWTGEGFGSAQANARNMAEILSGVGITDISHFGQVPIYSEVQRDYRGLYVDSNGDIVDPTKVTTKDGQSVIQTGTTYGNKITGQAITDVAPEQQQGAWGGTYAGSGNTGYRVFFDDKGNPHFYTTAGSSNTLANILQDNALLNVAANIGASVFGGPLGVAALQAAQGKDLEDIAKAVVLQQLGQQVGNYVTDAAGQAFNPDVGSAFGPDNIDIGGGFNPATGGPALNVNALTNIAAKTVGNAAQQYVASGGKTSLGDAVLYGGINTGVNMVANQVPGYKDLPAPVKTFVDKSISSVIKDGQLSDAALQSAAIAAGVDAAKIGMNDYKANYPLDSKGLAELTSEERAAYDSGGMRGLQSFTLQNQVLAKADTYKEGEAAPPAETDHDAFLRSIGITPDTTGEWASPTNQEILDMFYSGDSGKNADDTVNVLGTKEGTSDAEPGFENWVDPDTVLVTGKKELPADQGTIDVTGSRLINAGDENVFDPGTTYNAGDENVFDPGTVTDKKVVDADKKVTDSGSKITVTPPGDKNPPPGVTTPKVTTPTPVSYKGSTTTTLDPIYAETGSDWSLFKTLDELLAESKAEKDGKKSKQKTKMASGGYLDDMLAESGSVDDLLKILRN